MKSKKWLLGLIGLLLAGGLFITACDDGSGSGSGNEGTGGYGTLYAYNNSTYRTIDSTITMSLLQGGSVILGPRTISIDYRWEVTNIPSGETYTLRVVDGYGDSTTRAFTVPRNGSRTLRYNGSSIVQD